MTARADHSLPSIDASHYMVLTCVGFEASRLFGCRPRQTGTSVTPQNTKLLGKEAYFASSRKWSIPWSCFGPDPKSVRKVDLVKALELFRYLQNYRSYELGCVILLSTGNRNGPRSCLTPYLESVKKVDIVKVLKLFSYLQNYQSYWPGSVKQSPNIGILVPTGNGSRPIWTKLGMYIPHGASSNR